MVARVLGPLWDEWTEYAHRVARYQTAILLGLSYILVIGPVWLVSILTRRTLLPYRGDTASMWLPRRVEPRSLTDLARLY